MQSSRVEAGNSAVSRHRNLEVQAGTEFVTEKNADLGSAWGVQVVVWTPGNVPRTSL